MLTAFYRRSLYTVTSFWALMLAGCSMPTPSPQTILENTDYAAVTEHQQRLDSIFRWRLSARLAIVQKANDERDGLYLNWDWQRQPDQHQNLRFSHPLKGQLASLTITPQGAQLNADGEQYQDRSAERLLHRVLGLKLPVNALSQWVLGKVTPSLQQRAFIAGGRIAKADVHTAAGQLWSLQWFYGEQLLPQQIHLESNQLRIKLQLNNWQISPELAPNDAVQD